MWVVGIDPGVSGAVAFVSTDGLQSEVFRMPRSYYELAEMLQERRPEIVRVYIELQKPIPRDRTHVSSLFKLAQNYGAVLAVVELLGLSYEVVPPRKWQGAMLGAGVKKRKDLKELSLEKAKQLFPALRNAIGRNHNKSDALLLAEYGRIHGRHAEEKLCATRIASAP